MGRLIFELTDDDRAALERKRIELGCRSHAETLRQLIRGNAAFVEDCAAIRFSRGPGLPSAEMDDGSDRALKMPARKLAKSPKIVIEPKAPGRAPKSEWALRKEAELAFRPHPKPGKGK